MSRLLKTPSSVRAIDPTYQFARLVWMLLFSHPKCPSPSNRRLLGLFVLWQLEVTTHLMFGNDKSSLDTLINRPQPSWLQLFLAAPYKTLAKLLYAYRPAHYP